MADRRARVAAYAVCVRADEILLVHQAAPGPAEDRWTLPGGGVNFGEHPTDAVVRELAEETGLTGTVGAVIGVHDNVYDLGDGVIRHGVRLLFRVEPTGDTRADPTGEIDAVAWHRLDQLPDTATEWAKLGAELSASA